MGGKTICAEPFQKIYTDPPPSKSEKHESLLLKCGLPVVTSFLITAPSGGNRE